MFTLIKEYYKVFKIGGARLVKIRIKDDINGTSEWQYSADLKSYYEKRTGKELNLRNPRTYNEKIQWLKLYDTTPLKTKLTDKYLVREWVSEKIGNEYLIPLLGVWEKFEDIDFNILPDKFVLKANHGSGMNYIVKDKNDLILDELKELCDRWLETNFAFKNGYELQYKDIPRKLIAEQYIEELDGNLYDYKIHCFNGKPEIIEVIGNRDLSKHTAKEAFFDTGWNRNDIMDDNVYELYEEVPEKPVNFEELLSVAEELSSGFIYVRVDLYDLNGNILFGEMTFTPSSGFAKWEDRSKEYYVGDMIKLK